MSAPAVRAAAPAVAPRLASLLALASQTPNAAEDIASYVPKIQQPKAVKSFKLHIGGEIHLPTRHVEAATTPSTTSSSSSSTSANYERSPSAAADAFAASASAPPPPQQQRLHDPFEGVPLRAWAERLGAKVMPAYEAVKAEEARRKKELALAAAAGRSAPSAATLSPLSVPSIFPITRWAASSPAVRSTLVAPDDARERPRARLSWYHPDDTMVPRDWLKGGLLKDLEYYRPFRSPTPKVTAAEAEAAVA